MLFSFNGANGKLGLGTTGLGGLIQEGKAFKADIESLKGIREGLSEGLVSFSEIPLDSTTGELKGLTEESRNLLQTWQKDGIGAEQAIKNIDGRINELSKTGSVGTQKLKQFGDTIVNGLVSLGASLAISLAIEGIQKLIHSYEDLAKAAQEYASKYTDNKSTIEGYSSEIRELRDVLADQNSSTEEVANATSRLYEIQNELVGTYGSYANGIDLVNGKLNQQLEILDNINKQNAQEALNNINNERSAASGGLNLLLRAGLMANPMTNFVNGISDVQKSFKGIKNEQKPGEVLKEMFFGDIFGYDLGDTLLGSSVEQITDKFENFNATIKDIDDTRIRQLAEGLDSISFDGDDLKIDGSVESVTEDITILQARLNELNTNGQFDDIVKKLQSVNKDATETLISSKETYDTIIMSDIYNNAQLFDYYRQVQQAYEDIKKAESSGTFEEVQQAKNVYKELVDGIEQSGIDQKYIEYFERMYPELQSLVDEWKLEVEIIPKLDDNSKNLLKTTSTDELVAEYNKYFGEDRTVTKEIEDAVRANLSKGDAQALDYFKEHLSPKEYEEVIWKYVEELDLVSDDLQSLVEAYANSGMVDFKSFVNATRGTKEYSEGMVHARELLGDNWRDEFEDEFTDEELEIAATIEPRYTKESQEKYNELVEKLPENFPGDLLDLSKQVLKIDPYKIDELKKLIEERLNPLELDIEPKVNSADAVEKLDKMESSFGGLTDIYNTTVTNKDIASANDIQSVNSGFGGVTFNEEEIGNVNALSNALEAYDDALVESKGDAEAAQQAVNKLVTAYIDQSGILDDLTEENKDYYIERLKANGVTNAAEVVESRLSKEVKRTSDNLKNLSKVVAQNRENLDKGVGAGADYTAAIEAISDSVKALLFTDADGKELIPNVNPEFITKNLDDIYKAVEGDIDALNRLRVEAAKEIAAHIDITSDNPQEVLDEVNALINAYPIDDIKVGTYLNDTPLIQGLNNLVKAGKITQESMNSILSSIGVTPEISYEKASVTASMLNDLEQEISQTRGKSKLQLMAQRSKLRGQYKMEMQVPTIKYKATGGAGAKYSAPSAPKSSGGGGGGGGNSGGGGSSSASEPNKPQEEAEDSFDWIEVAIQRIEEEIERLDKVVNNSYTTWTKRNSALVKELQKTKDEIKAQAIAQQEYRRYLGTIKINNGKGLNADDYGENDQLVKQRDQRLLDEARRLWATGQYQRKIQQGQMTGNDIEKIQNHFLVDAINEYKEYYQKVIDAGDAVEDLRIKLGELARTNFDNVQKQFEETLQYFEASADLIDERINRTEEKGYFVSTKYYDNLISNEKKSLSSLQSEYNNLIAKRDDAVRNGYISARSEEWHAMNNEILSVAKSIEEASTNLVTFQNEIRQIKWDVFDYTRERIEKVNDEFEFLIDLLDNQKLYDDYGAFNDRGWADAALHAQKYNVYMQQSLDYAKERTQVEKELAKDNANKTLIERREELIKLQQESIQNSYAEKEAIRDLVEEGINIHLEKLNELIDEYKRAMHDARDLYSYQKNIAEQTKNISNIQKQLQAYQGDDSEEMRATIQKLRTNLEQAQTQLQETQWDKYISETETFLQDMYDDYSETLMARLDNVDLLVTDLIDDINANSADIKTIVGQVANEVAYPLTNYANTAINNGTLVSDFKNRFDTYATNTEAMINEIKNYITGVSQNTVPEAVKTDNIQNAPQVNTTTAIKAGSYNPVRNGVDYSAIFDLNYYMNKYSDLVEAFGTNYDAYLDHFIKYGMKEGRRASETFDVNYYKNKYSDLQKAYGNNLAAYYQHFLNHGIKEGRQASSTFDVNSYKNAYQDLRLAYGNDNAKYLQHYNTYGQNENRIATGVNTVRNPITKLNGVDYSAVYDYAYYVAHNPDVKRAYGNDDIATLQHFINYGMKEGRQASANFNVAKYKGYYADLRKAYGNNLVQYYLHYIKYGKKEKRKSYATGTRSANNEQAWTNEGALYGKGGEIIYRRSDGAILTPLHNGDKVFTAEMSDNLWNLAKLGAKPNVPLTNVSRTVNNNNAINITLPNVTNYEQFKTQLKNDPNMTNFIQEITLGEVTTGVKLNKRKL